MSAYISQLLPQIVLLGVAVRIGVEVVRDPAVERLDAQEVGDHPDDGAALIVGHRVKVLHDLVGVVGLHADGVRGLESVAGEGRVVRLQHEAVQVVGVRLHHGRAQVLRVRREAFVQPEAIFEKNGKTFLRMFFSLYSLILIWDGTS